MLKNLVSRVEEAGGLQPSVPPKCPKCNDTQLIEVIPESPGHARTSRFCECREEIIRQKQIKLFVPERWRGLRASDLQPYPGIYEIFPLSHQKKLIKIIQSDPYRGYAFFGPSGCGKSRFLHCLLQESLYAGKEIFYSKMGKLIQVMKDNELGRLPEERWHEILDADDLRNRKPGKPLHIFIDEIDKISITDDVFLKFLELIDFIYENKSCASLNICSNLSSDNFSITWGDALLRRIEDVCQVIEIKAVE